MRPVSLFNKALDPGQRTGHVNRIYPDIQDIQTAILFHFPISPSKLN
jgi:hypothetical protein